MNSQNMPLGGRRFQTLNVYLYYYQWIHKVYMFLEIVIETLRFLIGHI